MLERLPALVLSERADDARRAGREMVSLRGVPMLPMPPHVVDAVARAAPEVFPRDSRGSMVLKSAVAEHLRANFALDVNPERELLVTYGAQHGLSVVMRALLEPGDEVLIPAPSYFFDGTVRLAGAVPRYVQSAESDSWRLPLGRLAAAITPRTRVILLCNPNNPTGNVPTRDELVATLELANQHGLYVVSDESYERYVHDGPGYVPQMSLVGHYDRLVTLTSLSKNYAFTSWRVGYVHAKPDLVDRIHIALEWDAINVADIPQLAAAAAISGPQDWLDAEFCTFRARRDLLCAAVSAAGFTVVTPAAGVFALVNLSRLGVQAAALEDRLLDVGITALSGHRFLGPGTHSRILYGGSESGLEHLGRQLTMLAGDT